MISSLKRRSWALHVIVLTCLVSNAYGLDANRYLSQYVRDYWNTESKFPGGAVNAIAQTSDGYLWIGTDRGLLRFDGFKFVQVSFSSSVDASKVPVLGLLTDASGNLWIRVQGSDLVRQKNGKFETVAYGAGPLSSQVTAVSKDRNGAVLVSDVIKGTFRFQGENPQRLATPKMVPGSSPVISVAETSEASLWLGTLGAGLFLLADDGAAAVNTGLPERKINCLLPIGKDDLWVGTDNGLYHWNGKGFRREALPSWLDKVQVLSLLRDSDSNVWAGTASGLLRINAEGISFSGENELRGGGGINALFEDREGNLWIGGARGLGRIRDSAFMTYSAVSDPRFEHGGPVYIDQEERAWFAPAQGGLYVLQNGHVQRVTSIPASDVVYSISGRADEVWVGRQRGGITRLQFRSGTVRRESYTKANGLAQNSAYAVYESRDGSVWAGTLNGGVSKFKDGHFTTYTAANGLASNTVTSILETRDGAMWFATPSGLSSLANDHWRTYTTVEGLPSPEVNCLFEDSSGTLWSGTSGGLAFFASNRFQAPHESPDVLRGQILGMAEDKSGRFWIATVKHVLSVPRDKLLSGAVQAVDIREYDQADGLESTEGVKRNRSVVSDSAGRIWFSLNSGLSVVHPSQINDSSVPALPHIEAITADDNRVNLSASVRVPPSTRRITFEYTGLSLAVPERVRFRYFLESFDTSWSQPVAAREAVYTNLGPGSYRFRLVASNSDGLWNGSEATVGFEVEPTLWQTWWFRASSAALILLLVGCAYLYRLHRLAKEFNIRLEERVGERTRIARELHDSLLQGVQGLMFRLQAVRELLPRRSDEAMKALDVALERGDKVIVEGRDTISDLRQSTVGNSDIAQVLTALGEELTGQSDNGAAPSVRVLVEGKQREIDPVLRDEIYRIAREALRNAFRHSKAQKIEAGITYGDSEFLLHVRDDGVGIAPEVANQGSRAGHWGLPGMRERAKNFGGKLAVWSEHGAGTEIELTVPAAIVYGKSGKSKGRRKSWFLRKKNGGVRGQES